MADRGFGSEVTESNGNYRSFQQQQQHQQQHQNQGKGKSKSPKFWSLNDPEVKRKQRVASYKVYTVEGRVKSSFRNGIRWFKEKCHDIFHGW